MAETILTNQADFSGLYGDECEIVFTSNEVSTTIIGGLTATKTADKKCWVNGPLNYTITVVNNSGVTISDLILTDYLDPNLVTLDQAYGVFINGTLSTTYTYSAGTLSVPLPPIMDGGTVTVTFRVMQV